MRDENELTITGLTPVQKMICELLWRMPSMHAVEDLCKAGGPEYYAMRDLMVAAQFDRDDNIQEGLKEWLTSL